MSIQIKSLLKRVAKTVIDDLDVHTEIDYLSIVKGAYDPATDQTAQTTTTVPDINVIESRIVEDDQDYLIANTNMKKLILPANSIPNITPSDDDAVSIDGTIWEIHKIKKVAGDAIYILFVRAP